MLSDLKSCVADTLQKVVGSSGAGGRDARDEDSNTLSTTNRNLPITNNNVKTKKKMVVSTESLAGSLDSGYHDEDPFATVYANWIPWSMKDELKRNKPIRHAVYDGNARTMKVFNRTPNRSMWSHLVEPRDRFQWSGRLDYTDDLPDKEILKKKTQWTEADEAELKRLEKAAVNEARQERAWKNRLQTVLATQRTDAFDPTIDKPIHEDLD